jgi:hypothetical protein
VPNGAIEEARKAVERIDAQLSQASVLNREVILRKKAQYGDPETLPKVLTRAFEGLSPAFAELGLAPPELTTDGLNAALSNARRAQLERVSSLTKRAGELATLRQRYIQAAETDWHAVREQRSRYGDPGGLPALLGTIQERLAPMCRRLSLMKPGKTLAELENSLTSARRAQPVVISNLEQQSATLNSMRERYHTAAVTKWEGVSERRAQWGDPATLPSLLTRIQHDLKPVLASLGLDTPRPTLPSLEASLTEARRTLPGAVVKLERRASELLALRDRYLQASQDMVEDVTVPPELVARGRELQSRIDHVGKSILGLKGQLNDLRAREEQAQALRTQVGSLPMLSIGIDGLRNELERLEMTANQATLYNQVLDVGREYLEQVQPHHCPLCKQPIGDVGPLLDALRGESPADVKQMRQKYNALRVQLSSKQTEASNLEAKNSQLAGLESDISGFPSDLEQKIALKEEDSRQAVEELTEVRADVSRIEGRIKMMTEYRQRLDAVVGQIKAALGKAIGPDLPAALEQAAAAIRKQAADVGSLDLQPITDELSSARHLYEIEEEERRLSQQLQEAVAEARKVLGPVPDEEIPSKCENDANRLRAEIDEMQSFGFQPIVEDLACARELRQIQAEEARLHTALQNAQTEVRQRLSLSPEQTDLRPALDRAIEEANRQAQMVNNINLLPVETELKRAAQLAEIQRDEGELRCLESNNQIANREKARLDRQIRRLTELRNALLDIAATTKRHQETIIMDVLSSLDIHGYYQQIDPHPAYTDLLIEPELTAKGTYNYWIKALTRDCLHSTYVQTRFSTAQANCAAIAIFLAVNQHLSKNLETLLLDDPSQSMDPGHKQRLAQTLAASPRQMVVATEDPEMCQFLRDSFDAPTVYEFGPWATEGARLI